MEPLSQTTHDHRLWLIEELDERMRRNPSYSLRAFAKFVQLSPASLSQVMSGKRRLSRKSAMKIIGKYSFSPEQAQEFLGSALGVCASEGEKPTSEHFEEINLDTFRLISDWIYDGILGLGDIRPNSSSPNWLADKLGVAPHQAKEAFDRLARLRLVRIRGSGFYTCYKQLEIPTEKSSAALRRYHIKNLRKAEEALDTDSVPLEFFSAITMAVDESRLPEARSLIKNFRRKFCRLVESGKKERVYTLSVQLFPLSKK